LNVKREIDTSTNTDEVVWHSTGGSSGRSEMIGSHERKSVLLLLGTNFYRNYSRRRISEDWFARSWVRGRQVLALYQ